jgi:hypothetical protein
MTFEEYYTEIIRAKEEYDMRIGPVLKELERTKEYAWNAYLTRITHANENLGVT